MEKVKQRQLEDRRPSGWKLFSFQELFFFSLFLVSCSFLALDNLSCNFEPFKMLVSRISVLASVLAVSQAQLYPGQSNLNHTCQLRTLSILA